MRITSGEAGGGETKKRKRESLRERDWRILYTPTPA
jgi:hypothetical protein